MTEPKTKELQTPVIVYDKNWDVVKFESVKKLLDDLHDRGIIESPPEESK